eukprot:scaffold3786_cov336-Prasinococcus_capsulatus_cf.AAC.2
MVDSRLRESLSLKSSSSWRTTASSSSPVAATGDGVGGAGTPTRSGVLLPEPLHVFRRSEEPERFVRLRPTDVISRWPASASVSVSRSALLSPAALCRLRSGDGLPACPGCEGTGDCGWSDMLLGAEACRDRGPRNSELNAEESAPLRLNRRDADARSFLLPPQIADLTQSSRRWDSVATGLGVLSAAQGEEAWSRPTFQERVHPPSYYRGVLCPEPRVHCSSHDRGEGQGTQRRPLALVHEPATATPGSGRRTCPAALAS